MSAIATASAATVRPGAYKLASLGFEVKELIGGLHWWRQDGFAVATGSEPGVLLEGELPVPVERCNEGATPPVRRRPFNDFGQPLGRALPEWRGAEFPPTAHCMAGAVVSSPLIPSATWGSVAGIQCRQRGHVDLPDQRPFRGRGRHGVWLREVATKRDPQFYGIIDEGERTGAGTGELPAHRSLAGSIEVGWLHFSPPCSSHGWRRRPWC